MVENWGIRVLRKPGIQKSYWFDRRRVLVIPSEPITRASWDSLLCEIGWSLSEST